MPRVYTKIDLSALERNILAIKSQLPSHYKFIWVVKADVYGCGLENILPELQEHIDVLAVANVYEALEIRSIGIEKDILLLSPVLPGEEREVIDGDFIPTVSSVEEVRRFDSLIENKSCPLLRVQIEIDTGMGRLGVLPESFTDVYEAIKQSKNISLHGIFTHFSSAQIDIEYTHLQRTLFYKALKDFKEFPERLLFHADNSAGLSSHSESDFINAVRVGIAPLGYNPSKDKIYSKARMESVVSVCSRVGLIKTVPKGAAISYDQTYKVNRDSTIAIVTAGYADGILLELSSRGEALLGGRRFPIIGRVTMDLTIIDITDAPDRISVGDEVVFVGSQGIETISLEEYAQKGRSIEWLALTSLNTPRNQKVYFASVAV